MKSGTLEGGKLVEDDSADTIEARALLLWFTYFFLFQETVFGFRIRLTKARECFVELSVFFFLLTR